ncbi:hypothetical protein COT75_00875 [Candidatus Beckwithbacteria bacterium CG10_big_fil_rev_8_21_14_0_10_34_10]|uniref:Cytidyltransferase-like domain-containing protein n=1 Tax=Candidatus Beckwithbacteria bacterium CG10_big_fil_rev_8_21_14_0_10_34_10 TaxID=1974495 RepID=A0A2H0WAJ1_9BACT|nr:MAG: hypothetical protein COT75_00875 [Candidatus Beckwithbacteria bacterium CG10_big_fil_rev_8_21_14_0_10_34_10]
MKKYRNLVLAGTFDHLHLGHQDFIKKSALETDLIYLGLSIGFNNNHKKNPASIQSFTKRKKNLQKYLQKENLLKKTLIFPLNDCFGPATTSVNLETISATKNTLTGAKLINQTRKKNRLKPLKINLLDLKKDYQRKTISSSRIRLGEINSQGFNYKKNILAKKNLYLPKDSRQYFKKPIGQLLKGCQKNISWASLKALKGLKNTSSHPIITIGDITTQAFLLNNIKTSLNVVDYRCQRKKIEFKLHQKIISQTNFYFKARNEPGTLSNQAISKLSQAIHLNLGNKIGLLEIKGEEDLLVLPAILLSPLKTKIFYGQPHQGLVKVEVNEKTKNMALNLISKFKSF